MKIGLFFGSFNPIHLGHLIIANHCLNLRLVDEIWFVVSPQSPFKTDKDLLDPDLRLLLVNLAILDNPKFKSCNIEFNLPKPSYTYRTMTCLKEMNPQDSFYIILGSDSFNNLPKWNNYDLLFNQNKFIIFERHHDLSNKLDNKDNLFFLTNTPLMNISSTFIRESLKLNHSIKYLVSDVVQDYILKHNLYS